MITKDLFHLNTLLLLFVGGILFAVLTTSVSVSAAEYPCGTYGSGDYTSSPDCTTPNAHSSSSTSTPTNNAHSSSSPVTSPALTTGADAPSQTSSQKAGWNWWPYLAGVIVVAAALIIWRLIRHNKSRDT